MWSFLREFLILTLFSSQVTYSAYYVLTMLSIHCTPDAVEDAGGLNSEQESNIQEAIWSFLLELLTLDLGYKRRMLQQASAHHWLSFSAHLLVWSLP